MFLKKEAPNFFIFLRLDNDNGDAGQNDSFKVRSQTDVAIQEQLDSVFLRKKKERERKCIFLRRQYTWLPS